jgi:hypothetical protein
MTKLEVVQMASEFVVSEKGEELMKSWGGARLGAGRPRTESLSAPDLRFLAELVDSSPYASEYADLLETLRRMADRVERAGR